MTLQRMDNVGIVVDDLAAAIAFFDELGLDLEGETQVEGHWVDRVVGLDSVRVDIAMMRTPDGHSRLELMTFHRPTAVSVEPKRAPVNALGIRRLMFAVEDIEDVLARLEAHGAELVGELEQYENTYRLCYVRGPRGHHRRAGRAARLRSCGGVHRPTPPENGKAGDSRPTGILDPMTRVGIEPTTY